MKKKILVLFATFLVVSLFSCKNDKSGNDPAPEVTYNVEYKFVVNDEHGDINLNWFADGDNKNEISNPVSPWQMEYTNFKSGDSIAFNFVIIPIANSRLIYNWEVNITGDNYINGNSGSNDVTIGAAVPPDIKGGWSFKLP